MRALLAVFLGGIVGTASRLALDTLIPHTDTQFPVSTLIVNVVGSFALAVLVARFWPNVPEWVRAALGPGFMGGFTTFSAVMASMVTLAEGAMIVQALGYLGISLVGGIGAAALGFWIARPRNSMPTIEIDELIWIAALLGGVGAVIRYLISRAYARRANLPWAVFTVNVIGSAVSGVAIGLASTGAISGNLRLDLVGGFAGGLTTFSTWSVETIQLVMERKVRTALANVVLNVAIGLAAATAGYLVATALS